MFYTYVHMLFMHLTTKPVWQLQPTLKKSVTSNQPLVLQGPWPTSKMSHEIFPESPR